MPRATAQKASTGYETTHEGLSSVPNLSVTDYEPSLGEATQDILAWLSGRSKTPPARLLYDEAGALLFEDICATPEYYLTRAEEEILASIPAAIRPLIKSPAQIVEYGSGSNRKIAHLLQHVTAIKSHVPVDISKEHLIENAAEIARAHPDHQVTAICADFFQPFSIPTHVRTEPVVQNIGFFPGSTIGNMPEQMAVELLRNAHARLGENSLFLLAVDLVKDADKLVAAYHDKSGASARFSLNLIDRINREMDGSLDKEAFRYQANFNAQSAQIEMGWRVMHTTTAKVAGEAFTFFEGQYLLVEISRKFTPDSVQSMTKAAGYEVLDLLTDRQNRFGLAVLKG